MNNWQIVDYLFPGGIGRHPAVIVSNAARAANKPSLEILRCGTQRATRQAGPGEVILDAADGLDWKTLCFCDLIWMVDRDDVKNARGNVTLPRRGAVVRAILQSHE